MGPCVRRDDSGILSRDTACPKFCNRHHPLKIRGRGEDRMRAAPEVSQAVCKRIGCPRAYRFSGEHPAFPAQWLYGLYEIVLVTLLFVTPSSAICFRFRQLDACTGASDPNDFTVRYSPFVSRAAASTAPCPSFATMANAPLVGQDGGSPTSDLPDGASDLFLREGLDRFSVICPSGHFVAASIYWHVGQISDSGAAVSLLASSPQQRAFYSGAGNGLRPPHTMTNAAARLTAAAIRRGGP